MMHRKLEHDIEVDDDDACVCNKTNNVQSTLFGSPKGWSPPGQPEDWNPRVSSSRGEPPMDDVDNQEVGAHSITDQCFKQREVNT